MADRLLTKGARVRWGEEWVRTHPGLNGRQKVLAADARGTITYVSVSGCVRVQWDHLRTLETVAESLLELVEDTPNG